MAFNSNQSIKIAFIERMKFFIDIIHKSIHLYIIYNFRFELKILHIILNLDFMVYFC
jgi:hypothetical protein